MPKGFLFPVLGILAVGAAVAGVNIALTSNSETSASSTAAVPTEPPPPPEVTAVATLATNSEPTPEPKPGKPKLLFFMNPEGRPCQLQDQALSTVRASLEAVADLVYIKTTNPADEAAFYRYGIRSLPALIILGGNGVEAKRFPPGIQDPQEILAALKEVK